MSSERQVIRNWEAFKLMLEDSQTTDQSRSMANILFAPNENLEVLVSELTKTDGEGDFESFIHFHRTIVDYFTEIDDYIGISPRFKAKSIRRLKNHHTVQTGYEHHERYVQELSDRIRRLKTAQDFLKTALPQLHHALFDDINLPENVYHLGRRCLREASVRSAANQEANSLIQYITGDLGTFLEKVSIGAVQERPYSESSMRNGISYYLKLTLGAILVDNELEETGRGYNEAVSRDVKVLKPSEREELFRFRHDTHPIYNAGRYAGYAHVVTPKILVKIAKEFSDAGGNISFNINL